MPEAAASVPAQPDPIVESSAAVSAVDAAVASGDQAALKLARQAERAGKPLPDMPAAAPAPAVSETPPAPAPESKPVSKRQQAQNDAIRDAVERATVDLRAEIERLRGAPRSADQPPASDKPASAPVSTWQDAIKRPDLQHPMLTEEQFFATYPEAPYAAYGRYWGSYDQHQEQAEAQTRAQAETRDRALTAQAQRFFEKVGKAKEADPDLAAKVPPEVIQARPASTLAPGEPITFANVVAEAAFRADDPIALLTHLHSHPEEAARIADLAFAEWYPALVRLDGRLSASRETPAAPVVKTQSDAPPPPPTLGSRPADPANAVESAARNGDQGAYKAAKQRERAAALGR